MDEFGILTPNFLKKELYKVVPFNTFVATIEFNRFTNHHLK